MRHLVRNIIACQGTKWHASSSSHLFSLFRTQVNMATHQPKFKDLVICKELYQKWAAVGLKLYKNAPKEGLKYRCEYLDIRPPGNPRNELVVLALHGAPGTYEAYEPITKRLTGIRDVPVRM